MEQCIRLNNSIQKNLKDYFPIVLSGDHSSALGTISGIKSAFPEQNVGAPWIATIENTIWLKYFNIVARKFRSKNKNNREQIFFKVGNGGFSLRRTSSHYSIVKENEPFITQFLNADIKEIYAIEDVFWSLKAPEFDVNFKIPDYKEALNFAIDRKPKIAFGLINNQLPFGCHGINKPKVVDFWKPILNKY